MLLLRCKQIESNRLCLYVYVYNAAGCFSSLSLWCRLASLCLLLSAYCFFYLTMTYWMYNFTLPYRGDKILSRTLLFPGVVEMSGCFICFSLTHTHTHTLTRTHACTHARTHTYIIQFQIPLGSTTVCICIIISGFVCLYKLLDYTGCPVRYFRFRSPQVGC